jgi:hypothetical protein
MGDCNTFNPQFSTGFPLLFPTGRPGCPRGTVENIDQMVGIGGFLERIDYPLFAIPKPARLSPPIPPAFSAFSNPCSRRTRVAMPDLRPDRQ